ncbi:hypothetical protein BH10PSE9_BH10PSE9_04070 [soil metagenome]
MFGRMDIDIWEVIEAARTKPFGFMPFYPGPGVGGHCVPVDPVYLLWKAQRAGATGRLMEVAGEINASMPQYVVQQIEVALRRRLGLGLQSSRILVLGIAYKKNVTDVRESPALELMELLERAGASVSFHDPQVPVIPSGHDRMSGRRSIPLTTEALQSCHTALIVTDHDDVDYEAVVRHASLVVDTRNVCERRGLKAQNIVKA